MKVGVWDTYVVKKDNSIMHFDIMVPTEMKDAKQIYSYGKIYLKSKGQEGQELSLKECNYCHIEESKPLWKDSLLKNGYYIFEIENCK